MSVNNEDDQRIRERASVLAKKIASPEGQESLRRAAAESRARVAALVERAVVDSAFLKKRVTF